MSTACPKGHESEWPDWCSVCGERLAESADGAAPAKAAVAASANASASTAAAPSGAPAGPSCTNCGEPSHVDDVFCESCGYDFASGTLPVADGSASPAAQAEKGDEASAASNAVGQLPLTVVVTVDPSFFAATTADVALELPEPVPDPRTVTLAGSRNLVGRRSESRGILPEIDVQALTNDPGVSSRHLMFERSSAGLWTMTDLGSTNGTYLSKEADAEPITPGEAHEITDAVAVWLGAWTRLDLAVDPST